MITGTVAVLAGVKLIEPLICVGLKAVLNLPTDDVQTAVGNVREKVGEHLPSVGKAVGWLKERFTDHSLALPKAVTTAHDRAWQAVALALATDNIFSHVANFFRDGDLKAVQKQIREFVATADTGLDGVSDGLRTKACNELIALKKAGRFGVEGVDLTSLDLTRFASTAKVAEDAHRAVRHIVNGLEAEAPHLSQVLTLTPPAGGTPLLAAAFAYFLRREIETKGELFRGLLYDQVQLLTLKQQAGFANLERSLDSKWGELFETLGGWFAQSNATQEEMLAILRKLATDNRVPTQAEAPSEITISTEEGRAKLREVFQKVLSLPAEFVQAELLQLLGDDCAAAGLFSESLRAQTAAAAAAKEAADRAGEADFSFRAYKSACECQPPDYPTALTHLLRSAALDPVRFSPFDRGRYHPLVILGHGGFGTVFLCDDRDDPDNDGVPQKVAVKTFRAECLERDPREVFREARTLRDLHRPGSRFVRVIHWDHAHKDAHDPNKRDRPYIVMEYFPGETLDKLVSGGTAFTPAEVVNLFRQIAEAVNDAHGKGVFHRDLKPSNVMARKVAEAWEVRVIDFGLAVKSSTAARASQNQAGGESTKADRSFTGTWDFAPPEQRGKAPHIKPGPWSDVYAFGKTLAWVLFRTTEPKAGHWKKLPEEMRDRLKELFEDCTYDELRKEGDEFGRLHSFSPVLDLLRELETSQGTPPPPRTVGTNDPRHDVGGGGVASVRGGASGGAMPLPTFPIGRSDPLPADEGVILLEPDPAPSKSETPAERLKRWKREAADKTAQARGLIGKYDYASAVKVLEGFTPDQQPFRENELLADTTAKRDQLATLARNINKLLSANRLHAPQLSAWVPQYIALKPDDADMRALLTELPPPNDPPTNPKPGERFTLKVAFPEPDHRPGELMTLRVRIPEPAIKPGAKTMLTWKAVPKRPNPNK